MVENKEQIVGILGGMGPEATVDLMQRIIRLTPAQDDIRKAKSSQKPE